MQKNGKLRKWLIIIATIIFLCIIGGITFMMAKHHVSIREQHLNQYQYSSGGGMNGGYYHETVKRYDTTHALISIEKTEWYGQDPETKEYLVDVSVLDELEGIVRKYRMNFWNRKVFSKIFICDGETEGYSFRFDENDISFSSQVYPIRYRNKLQKLDETIEQYLKNATELPGLVNTKKTDGESYDLPEDKLEVYIYSYIDKDLGIRILNGTAEEIEIPYSYQLINTTTAKVTDQKDDPSTKTVYPESWDEMSFSLQERLAAGNYKLVLGEMEIPFEIR